MAARKSIRDPRFTAFMRALDAPSSTLPRGPRRPRRDRRAPVAPDPEAQRRARVVGLARELRARVTAAAFPFELYNVVSERLGPFEETEERESLAILLAVAQQAMQELWDRG